jgi:hypothetical protein
VETTTVFFGVTKLFQSTNSNLRRMMYLFIKEVAETCNPDDVIIVTSSLTKVCFGCVCVCDAAARQEEREWREKTERSE